MYATILTLMFITININLTVYWKSLRQTMIVSDDTLGTMSDSYLWTPNGETVLVDFTARTTIFLADIILVDIQLTSLVYAS